MSCKYRVELDKRRVMLFHAEVLRGFIPIRLHFCTSTVGAARRGVGRSRPACVLHV